MTLMQVTIDVLLAVGVVAAVILCGYRVVVWARKRLKRAYAVGVLFTPFIALGNVSDPDFRIVNEAKQHKQREEDEPGDPPTLEDEAEPEPVASKVSRPKNRFWRRTRRLINVPAGAPRPWAAWTIAVVLGLMAILSTVSQSLILASDPANLAPRAREVLASFTVFEWASLYALHATLLVSMFMLFRLRRGSIWLFAAYVSLGLSLSAWCALRGEPIVPPAVTMLGTAVAAAILAYMWRLKKQGRLA